LREELRQAALKRRERLDERPATLTEVERVLLRALAGTNPEDAPSRRLAAQPIEAQPAWFEHLASYPALQVLVGRQARDPMEAVEDEAQRALLAEALLGESRPPEPDEVAGALQEIEERWIEGQLRDVRAGIAEAESRGDFAELALLTQKKLELDRALRQIHNRRPPEG
jgi:DNA primase